MTDPAAPIELRIEEALRADPSGSTLLLPPLGPALLLAYTTDKPLWMRIRNVIGSKKGLLRTIEPVIRKMAHEAHRIPQIGEPGHTDADRVIDVWPEAGELRVDGEQLVDPECTVPFGYKIEPKQRRPAISRERKKVLSDGTTETSSEIVSINGILVTRNIMMVATKQLYTEIAFCRMDKWRTIVVPNAVALNHRKFSDVLLDRGVMATATQTAEICNWLLAYWEENKAYIPQTIGAAEMGWHGEGAKYGFLLGKEQIANPKARRLEFHVEGDDTDADAYKPMGTMAGWLEMLATVADYPAMKIAVYASLAAPLLHVLQLGNCLVDFACETSQGKSTALRLGESCWRSYQQELFNWDTTLAAVEDRARRLNDLPLVVDETQLLDPQMAGRFVYGILGGRTRGRADRLGAERLAKSWRTMLITSGEQPVSEHAHKAGASARSLSILTPPLGPPSVQGAELAHALRRGCKSHCGHAGRAVVRWLVDHRDRWDELKDRHRDQAARLRDGSSGAQSRMADVVALLELTAAIVLEAIPGFPWTTTQLSRDPATAALLGEAVSHAVVSADVPTRAFEYMLSVAAANPQRWWLPHDKNPTTPSMGWFGRSDRGERELCWLPSALRKVLEEGRFASDAVQRAWRERGWLVPDAGRPGFTRKVTFIGGRERMVCVREDALELDPAQLKPPAQRELPIDDPNAPPFDDAPPPDEESWQHGD